jgi:hypothetical protein
VPNETTAFGYPRLWKQFVNQDKDAESITPNGWCVGFALAPVKRLTNAA